MSAEGNSFLCARDAFARRQRADLKHHLLYGTAIVSCAILAASVAPRTANATCTPGVGSPVVINCTGSTNEFTYTTTDNTQLRSNSATAATFTIDGNDDTALKISGTNTYYVDIKLDSDDKVTADNKNGGNGIYVTTSGTGAITIDTAAEIKYKGNGIKTEITNTSSSAKIDIDNSGSITGTGSGTAIIATHAGTGAIEITNASTGIIASGGDGIYAEQKNSSGGPITIINSGGLGTSTTRIGTDGIQAKTAGSGTVTIENQSTGKIYTKDVGILAEATATSIAKISITNAGLIDAQDEGIKATSAGTGAIEITNAAGGSIASGADGIYAEVTKTSGGPITITNSGGVGTSATRIDKDGIQAKTAGSGTVTIENQSTGKIYTKDVGILAEATATSIAKISITNAGLIDAQDEGIKATSAGTGAIEITNAAGGSIASGADGIYAEVTNTSGGPITITNSGGVGTSATRIDKDGIQAKTAGSGTVTIENQSTGKIYTKDVGILAEATATSIAKISITNAGLIDAQDEGIKATSAGTGAIEITNAAGGSIASGADGIYAEVTNTSGGPITITNSGGVGTSTTRIGGDGLSAKSAGLGTITLENQAGGEIYTSGVGIKAESTASGTGDIGVTNAGLVDATKDGINAQILNPSSSGKITIENTAGSLTSGGVGISTTTAGTGAIKIVNSNKGSISAKDYGIRAQITNTDSLADIDIVNSWSITTTASSAYGINATSAGKGAISITNTGSVTTKGDALYAELTNPSGGAIGIHNSGPLGTSAARIGGEGISAKSAGLGTITLENQAGGEIYTSGVGIKAESTASGTGDIGVTNAGLVDATKDGINAQILNPSSSGKITIENTAGSLTSGGVGISTTTAGTGAIKIVNSNKGSISANDYGIRAQITNTDSLADIDIVNSWSITTTASSAYGINATSAGKGAISITNSASVATKGDALYAELTNPSGGAIGIHNSGPLGTSAARIGGDGISAKSAGLGTITLENQAGGEIYTSGVGIKAESTASGTGDIGVTNAGLVDATKDGINAQILNPSSSGKITIENTAGSLTSGGVGISTTTAGTGAIKIVNSNKGSISANDYGIRAQITNTDSLADIDIVNSWSITTTASSAYGINATSAGKGAISITNSASVATKGDALYAELTNPSGGAIGIHNSGPLGTSAARIGGEGISAKSAGLGTITLENQAGGEIYTSGVGIKAESTASGTGDIGVTNAGLVDATKDGINAQIQNATSKGIISVGNTGSLTSSGGYGIYATTAGTAKIDITNAGGVASSSDSLHAELSNALAGDITVNNTAGSLTSSGGYGIFTKSASQAGSIGITNTGTGSINASSDGIFAQLTDPTANGGITIDNTWTVKSSAGYGIYAANNGSGTTKITSNGSITAASSGIYANTVGDVAVTVNGGTVTGTTGIEIVAGAKNSILNKGTVTSSSGTAGTAIKAGAGNETLDNLGTITGLTDLGDGTNLINNSGTMSANSPVINGGAGDDTVNNLAGATMTGDVDLKGGKNAFDNSGTFNAGSTVFLGAFLGTNNVFSNAGTFNPGGDGNIQITNLTGDFKQNSGGTFAVDVDSSTPDADKLIVTGKAELEGQVLPKVANLQPSTQNQQFTILTSSQTSNLGITVQDTAAITYQLVFPNANDMVLEITNVDFIPGGGGGGGSGDGGGGGGQTDGPNFGGANQNLTSIGNYVNNIFFGGTPESLQDLIAALANLPTEASLASALNQLAPAPYANSQVTTLFSALSFTNSFMTCPVREGAAAFIREGECVWARASGRSFDQDGTKQTLGFDEESVQVSSGVQFALGDVWRLGFAAGYEHGWLDSDPSASAEADRVNGGAVLKYNPGRLLLAAAVSAGHGWYDTERAIAFPGFSAFAKSDNDVDYANGRLRAAYLFSSSAWYLKPQVDLDATYVDLGKAHEHGAGGVDLIVHGNDETVLSATPALELGRQFAFNGVLARPYIRGGVTFFDDPDFVVQASFEGAQVGTFAWRTETDDVVANVSAGVDLLGIRGASLKLSYDGRFGDTVEEHAGGAKATVPF